MVFCERFYILTKEMLILFRVLLRHKERWVIMSNRNRDTEKKYHKNIAIGIPKRVNALKNTVYSSIYVMLSFLEQSVVLELLADSFDRLNYIIWGFISLIVLIVLSELCINRARIICESYTFDSVSSNIKTAKSAKKILDKVVDCATLLGYLSPLLCVASYIGKIDGQYCFEFKWGIIGLVILLGIVLPVLIKKKNCTSEM